MDFEFSKTFLDDGFGEKACPWCCWYAKDGHSPECVITDFLNTIKDKNDLLTKTVLVAGETLANLAIDLNQLNELKDDVRRCKVALEAWGKFPHQTIPHCDECSSQSEVAIEVTDAALKFIAERESRERMAICDKLTALTEEVGGYNKELFSEKIVNTEKK